MAFYSWMDRVLVLFAFLYCEDFEPAELKCNAVTTKVQLASNMGKWKKRIKKERKLCEGAEECKIVSSKSFCFRIYWPPPKKKKKMGWFNGYVLVGLSYKWLKAFSRLAKKIVAHVYDVPNLAVWFNYCFWYLFLLDNFLKLYLEGC